MKSGESQNALNIILGIDELYEKSGDVHRQAITLGNQASALEKLNLQEQAAKKYEESSRLFKQIGDLENRSIVLQSLSELQMKMGHQLDAMATMQVSLLNKKKPSIFDRFLKKLLQIPFRS